MKNIFLICILLIATMASAQQDDRFRGRLSYTFDSAFEPFYHGVASGDPLSDRVIIWTRVTSFTVVDSIEVEWYFATDSTFTNPVASGVYQAKPDRDFTVKVDVTGLQPDTWYYYYFHSIGHNSVIGRTRTMPVGDCDSIRFALISGSNYNSGYYNAYRDIGVRNDIDGVIHLGDYIYEYESGGYGDHSDRNLEPVSEILTLSDYRMRYSHYRLDPDLRFAHQQYPWYVIYDDHEVANDGYIHGAENHDPGTEGLWNTRFSAGIQAFMEWIPIREINDPVHPENKIHRTIPMGDLAEMILIDTRYEGRSKQDSLSNDDVNKTMLGTAQYNWLTQELYDAQFTDNTRWKIIGNQVMFVPMLVLGAVANQDQWDGYQYERQRLMDFMYGWGIGNVVIITGDIHTSWANDVPNNSRGVYGANGAGSECVEFVTPSVTSPSTNDFFGGIGSSVLQSMNPHMKWINLSDRGYVVMDINKNRVQGDWYFVSTIDVHAYNQSLGSAWYVNNGERFLRQAVNPSVQLYPNPSLMPEWPAQINPPTSIAGQPVVIGVYPNPFNQTITVQYYKVGSNDLQFCLSDESGKIVYSYTSSDEPSDLNYHRIDASGLTEGVYFLHVNSTGCASESRRMIKIKQNESNYFFRGFGGDFFFSTIANTFHCVSSKWLQPSRSQCC